MFLLVAMIQSNTAADCCARKLLSMQPDFQAQRCEVEEVIKSHGQHNLVMFYPKFHCELNHIEHFWCFAKGFARRNCEYSLEKLRDIVPESLEHVKNVTILSSYNRCRQKMALYREGLAYGSEEWKSRTCHQKIYDKEEDR